MTPHPYSPTGWELTRAEMRQVVDDLARRAREANRGAYRRAKAKMAQRHAGLTVQAVLAKSEREHSLDAIIEILNQANKVLEEAVFFGPDPAPHPDRSAVWLTHPRSAWRRLYA